MALKQSQLPQTPPSPPGYRNQPTRSTPAAPTTNARLRSPDGSAQPTRRTRAVQLPPVPPYVSSLTTDLDFLEQAAATKLDRLAKPTTALLSALRMASNTIARHHSTLGAQLRGRLRQVEDVTAQLVKSAQAQRPPGAGREDAKLTQQSVESKVTAEAVAKLGEAFDAAQQKHTAEIARRIIEAAGELENELGRLKLESMNITDSSELTLEELLRRQSTISDLESRGSNELLDYYQQLVHLRPNDALILEPALLKVAKQRTELVPARARARASSSQQASELDRLAAIKLVRRIEAARELRTGPELQTFQSEFRPHLSSLIRRTIGVEVSDLDRVAFEKYAQKFRPGARLGDIPLRYAWSLRSALSELSPGVRRQVPARFFSPVE